MKKIFFSIVALLFVQLIYAQRTLVYDDHAQPRNVTGTFKAIHVSGAIELILSQYEQPAIAVSASNDEAADRIKTVIDNGVLKVYYDGGKLGWKNGSKYLRVYVAFKQLDFLKISGASSVKVAEKITVPELSIDISGASSFNGNIDINKLEVESSGASTIKLIGKVEKAALSASGASDIKAYGLTIIDCDAEASGASDIQLQVKDKLAANASGASNIFFKGNPARLEKNATGASNVRGVE